MAPKNSSSKGDAKYGKKLFSWSKIYQSPDPSLEYSKWYVNVFRTSLDKLEKKNPQIEGRRVFSTRIRLSVK